VWVVVFSIVISSISYNFPLSFNLSSPLSLFFFVSVFIYNRYPELHVKSWEQMMKCQVLNVQSCWEGRILTRAECFRRMLGVCGHFPEQQCLCFQRHFPLEYINPINKCLLSINYRVIPILGTDDTLFPNAL
jgi:hypothetical protein